MTERNIDTARVYAENALKIQNERNNLIRVAYKTEIIGNKIILAQKKKENVKNYPN